MISDDLLDEAQRLIYRAWATAFDNHKKVKQETNDGSPDWLEFHNTRLLTAKFEMDRLKKLLDEINPLAPLTRKK